MRAFGLFHAKTENNNTMDSLRPAGHPVELEGCWNALLISDLHLSVNNASYFTQPGQTKVRY